MTLLFDDSKESWEFNLKKTDEKRYQNCFPRIVLKEDTIVHDWDIILKQPQNKSQFKSLFVKVLIESAEDLLDLNQELYLNGTETGGIVRVLVKSCEGLENYVLGERWSQRLTESDTKIFHLLHLFSETGFTKFLICSQDTDVKMLSLYWSSILPRLEITVQSGTILLPSFFYPNEYLDYMKTKFDCSSESLARYTKSLLQAFVLFGCDLSPGFVGISHNLALRTFDDITMKKLLESKEDFLYLILKTYEKKNAGLKRMMNIDDKSLSIVLRHKQTREVIKIRRGVESEAVPILSVLDLQLKRSEFITEFWIKKDCKLDPANYGWKETSDKTAYDIVFQDYNDPLFSETQSLLLGCSCKRICSKKCSCKTDNMRMNKCARLTCRFCPCYKRNVDGIEENLVASDQYQHYLDEISSSSDTSDTESLSSNTSSCSDFEY